MSTKYKCKCNTDVEWLELVKSTLNLDIKYIIELEDAIHNDRLLDYINTVDSEECNKAKNILYQSFITNFTLANEYINNEMERLK